ncbi:MAG TPA: HAMP domain-containing sensor histidine kinase [Pyrinomonadaceae bacterium]|nr:HAMP domain-containing sensor histidine kinase [Pyrinomonadaceae bacterium]
MNDSTAKLFKPFDETERIAGECFELIRRERENHINSQNTNRRKDEFLAFVAHEWRNTLNTMCGWLDLLGDIKLNENLLIAQGFAAIRRTAHLQMKLVEDLLDPSQTGSGKFRLNLRETNPSTIVETVLSNIKCLADAKKIKIEANLATDSENLTVDAERLEQVLLNLFSNAIKFTPPSGKIAIETKWLNLGVEIKVTDTGQGIDANFLPHIFEPFRQFSAFDAEGKQIGFGLGLSIVRQIVELHGGSIEVQSAGCNQGATFTIQIPDNRNTETKLNGRFQNNPLEVSFSNMSK